MATREPEDFRETEVPSGNTDSEVLAPATPGAEVLGVDAEDEETQPE